MSILATQSIRVLLVDDHRSVLWGLTKLIESARPQLELVDVATCHSEALAAMESTGRTSFCSISTLAAKAGLILCRSWRAKRRYSS